VVSQRLCIYGFVIADVLSIEITHICFNELDKTYCYLRARFYKEFFLEELAFLEFDFLSILLFDENGDFNFLSFVVSKS